MKASLTLWLQMKSLRWDEMSCYDSKLAVPVLGWAVAAGGQTQPGCLPQRLGRPHLEQEPTSGNKTTVNHLAAQKDHTCEDHVLGVDHEL